MLQMGHIYRLLSSTNSAAQVRDYCENLKRISELIHGASKKD